MKQPELILINHYASTPQYPGPTRNFDFAAALVKQGWRVSLLSCRFNHYLRRYLPKPPQSVAGVDLKWVFSTAYSGNTLQRELNILVFSALSFWAGLFRPAQIVVTVTPPLESALAGWILARVKRVPFVLDLEDLWPDSLIAMGFRNKIVIGCLRGLERFLYRHSEHILVVAEQMQEYLIQSGIPANKISLIPLGANLPTPRETRQTVRQRYGWEANEVIAVYVGAHGPANALDTLLRAAEQLVAVPGVKLVLFGDGSDKPRLQQLLNDLKLPNLILADPVAPELVPDILGAADIGIASLKQTETFKTVRPNKLYEYMAVGLPIICCIDGEARRLVETVNSGIYVTPEDEAGLAKALQELTVNPELRRRLGEQGRSFVIREGDRAKLAEQMATVLKKVIAG